MKKDYIVEIVKCCQKREEILLKNKPISLYNKYHDRIHKYKQIVFEENRQKELLPYLQNDSISIRSDIACILFFYEPKLCTQVLEEISNMKISTGLPKPFVMVSVAAKFNLEYFLSKLNPLK